MENFDSVSQFDLEYSITAEVQQHIIPINLDQCYYSPETILSSADISQTESSDANIVSITDLSTLANYGILLNEQTLTIFTEDRSYEGLNVVLTLHQTTLEESSLYKTLVYNILYTQAPCSITQEEIDDALETIGKIEIQAYQNTEQTVDLAPIMEKVNVAF